MIKKNLVADFYKDIPFNFTNDIKYYTRSISEYNQILEYKDLNKLLRGKSNFLEPNIKTVLEFGCGTGWLSNTISYYYKKEITAIDFTKKAIDLASKISKSMKLNVNYEVCDIFNYKDVKKYDLVVSLGVLHHTIDCRKAFKKITKFVKPNGHIYIGLYHLYGRRPMLNFLQNHAMWHGEKAAFNLFKRMNKDMKNEEHTYSWFRDQVLHPHETQHTLEELFDWIKEENLILESTSINNYKSLKTISNNDLVSIEKGLELYSYKKNVIDLDFSPGYFTICAKKVT